MFSKSRSVAALGVHTTARHMQASQEDFDKAQNDLKTLKKDPGNEVKLKLYALFKQVVKCCMLFLCVEKSLVAFRVELI